MEGQDTPEWREFVIEHNDKGSRRKSYGTHNMQPTQQAAVYPEKRLDNFRFQSFYRLHVMLGGYYVCSEDES